MLYPMFVNLMGKKVVVIGGGPVATRKLKGLVETGAIISVVSPTVTNEMEKLILSNPIDWLERVYQEGDLTEAHLVVVATNDNRVNQRILDDIRDWQWVNMAEEADLGNFQIPAQVKSGKLTIAISTEGASPELSKKIRKELSSHYGKDYEHYLEFLLQCRSQVKNLLINNPEKGLILGKLLDPVFHNPAEQQKVLSEFSAFVKRCLEESPKKI
jgi:precorrin-2 dehydrogenase / sirohydrochlorin ferrochelatase